MAMNNDGRALSSQKLYAFRDVFYSEPKNILALDACAKYDPLEVCVSRKVVENTNHVFTHKVDSEVKPITNQKNSGRCWIFSALNVLRIPFVKKYLLEEFEFSPGYIFYYEKIERCNFFLHTIVDVLKRGENIDGRLLAFLLENPIADGGQWHMIVNIITKYGVMPKKCYPETFCCETSVRLNRTLKSKIREYTYRLAEMLKLGSSDAQLESEIVVFMEELHRIISICLGVPPESFIWEYYNKEKTYCRIGPITPMKFYEEYVKPLVDLENMVCIVHDPRKEHLYRKTYTVDCLGNMIGGHRTVYLNLEMDEMIKYAIESIKSNEAVWFGCDIWKFFAGKLGIADVKVLDYPALFGVEVSISMTKEERLNYGESAMNHAMVFTAVSLNENGEPSKWRVENSWGDDRGDKGYLVMTNEWFKEFGFEIAVHKKFIPQEILDLLSKEPIMLPAWDPMGALAF